MSKLGNVVLTAVLLVLFLVTPFARAQEANTTTTTSAATACSTLVPHCVRCYASPLYPCMQCEANYTRTSQGQCVPVSPSACEVTNCLACVISTTHCTTCASGYYRTASGKCADSVRPYGSSATSLSATSVLVAVVASLIAYVL